MEVLFCFTWDRWVLEEVIVDLTMFSPDPFSPPGASARNNTVVLMVSSVHLFSEQAADKDAC